MSCHATEDYPDLTFRRCHDRQSSIRNLISSHRRGFEPQLISFHIQVSFSCKQRTRHTESRARDTSPKSSSARRLMRLTVVFAHSTSFSSSISARLTREVVREAQLLLAEADGSGGSTGSPKRTRKKRRLWLYNPPINLASHPWTRAGEPHRSIESFDSILANTSILT